MKDRSRPRRDKSVDEAKKSKPRFNAGMTVPQSGIYEAFHASHRVTHQVTLVEGQAFPPCARCKDKVQFELVRAVRRLTSENSPVVHVVGVFLPEKAA